MKQSICAELSTANWIVKSNALNEIRHTKMTITQIRLLSIYLSKINPKDKSSREVTFKLEEYAKIMEFKRFNIVQLRQSAASLVGLSVVYFEDAADGGFSAVSSLLFRLFKLSKNDNGEWIVNIDCHDDVLPLMFELKKYYFKYKLWNSLQLASPNQQRMYEILKQYEVSGAREISVRDLREFLGLRENEYPRWDNFRTRILEASQAALANHTDIKFTWEVAGKRGRGGKINNLKFHIEKNDDYMHQLTIEEFLQVQTPPVMEEIEDFEYIAENNKFAFLGEACGSEFSLEEIAVLHQCICEIAPDRFSGALATSELNQYDYLKRKYMELKLSAAKKDIEDRFAYLKRIIENDYNESRK